MKPEARLDSAVFQLTPTRTRCDLVITSNGKSEKLASGLLNPFLAHLKSAQDQIEKGGYSIKLEPNPGTEAFWFTKGTVERFVRFVSTPEVLERVSTVESEIFQIEEAITIQSNENPCLSTVENYPKRSTEYIEGSKPMFNVDAEKAIVLYKPGSHSNPSDSNGHAAQEENSKVQLLRVLETRKIVLQKEQAMAFARATAAGFDMDHLTYLIAFADSFGASRMKEACSRFMELWRVKHETGQWLELESAEAMSTRSGFSPFNASGIILSEDKRKQKASGGPWPASGGDLITESNGNDAATDHSSDKDKRLPLDPQVPHEYFHGQVQQPTYAPWAMHPPHVGAFQPYPMQGAPYYQSYPGSGPFYPPPYPHSEDPLLNTHRTMEMRRHSMNSTKDYEVDSEFYEPGIFGTRSMEVGADESLSDSEKETYHGRKSHMRVGHSGKKKSGMVVIRNLNYITSMKHESPSASDSESEDDSGSSRSNTAERKHKKSLSPSKKNGDQKRFSETSHEHDRDKMVNRDEADSGNWQAFQSFLLRAEEKMASTVDRDIFSGEKEPPTKRRQNINEAEPIFTPERNSGSTNKARIMEFDSVNGKTSRRRQVTSNDELLTSGERRALGESHSDTQFIEIEGGGGRYRRMATDNFMIYGRENQSKNSSDPLAEAAERGYKHPGSLGKISYAVTDESFVVPFRSVSQDKFDTDNRTGIDIDLAFPSSHQRKEDNFSNIERQLSYEPDGLTMIPERAIESECSGYNPAIHYDMQIPVEGAAKHENREQEDVTTCTKELKKSDKEKKLKGSQDGVEKRKKDAMMRGASSKSNQLTEAQKRAEKLRAFKVDLQKAKKANEEEERKRLEALKLERQKRIAARSGSTTAQSPVATKQKKIGLPTKVSPSSSKGSKFSDSEPGLKSSLQKLPKRSSLIGSNNSHSIARTSSSNGNTSGLTKSTSSLPELKKECNGTTAVRARRLSDPNMRNARSSSQKSGLTDQMPKRNLANGPQMKKISAIMQLDQTKSATLAELKVRTPRASDVIHIKSVTKEKLQKGSGSNTSQISVSMHDEKPPSVSNNYDNSIIKKTVVMLENEKTTAPAVKLKPYQGMIEAMDYPEKHNGKEKTWSGSEYTAIRAPPSPMTMDEISVQSQSKQGNLMDYYEVNDSSKDEYHNISSVTENFYRAPYARASSLEDAAASKLEYTGAPAVYQPGIPSMRTDSIKARVPDFSDTNLTYQIHESVEKPRTKESKGFRKLLKFGRKTQSSASGEGNMDSDGTVVDYQTEAGSSNDVQILKNLISQDDTDAGGTTHRGHRHFSILSSFRAGKSNEKKLAS